MSDEEEVVSGVEEEAPEPEAPKEKPKPTITPEMEAEAKRLMEQRRSQIAQVDDEEIREYMEERLEIRRREEEEIMELRTKIEQRRKERAEEDKRLEQMRKEEDEKRRQEEEERRNKKEKEERERREERERKRMEAEDRMKKIGSRNFVIVKKDGTTVAQPQVEEGGEVRQKTKEQLEAEKKAVLAQRVQPLNVEGLDEAALKSKAQELHSHWFKLEGEKYDLEQDYKRKQYDLMELSERARQVSKGGGGASRSYDRTNDRFSNAPPKVQMYSKYERRTDVRDYGERKKVFNKSDLPLEGTGEAPAASGEIKEEPEGEEE